MGGPEAGYTVWAHNSACVIRRPGLDPANPNYTFTNKKGDVIKVYGDPQVTNGPNGSAHAAAIMAEAQRIAQNAPAGSYIVLNRSWRTALSAKTERWLGDDHWE